MKNTLLQKSRTISGSPKPAARKPPVEIPADIAFLIVRLRLSMTSSLESEYKRLVRRVWKSLTGTHNVPESWTADEVARVATYLLQEREPGCKHVISGQHVRNVMMNLAEQGFLVFTPPLEHKAAAKLNQMAFGETSADPPADVPFTVVNCRLRAPDQVTLEVANAAGDHVFKLIRQVALGEADRPEVHLALGAGYTSTLVAERVVKRLRNAEPLRTRSGKPVTLVIHALSSNFDTSHPRSSPESKAALFGNLPTPMRYVGLIAEPVVPSAEFDRIIERPGVRDAFAARSEIDIVFSSLAAAPAPVPVVPLRTSRRDSSRPPDNSSRPTTDAAQRTVGLWNYYVALFRKMLDKDPIEELISAGWIADFQFIPFSATGEIPPDKVGIRSVTLFSLDDYKQLARTPGKHVVVAAGPGKSIPLYHLITEPNLRIWTHMVIDIASAELIEDLHRTRKPAVQ